MPDIFKMATWIIPTANDVQQVMSGVVIGAVQQTGTQDDDSDHQSAKVQGAIDKVVSRIRGAIAVGNRTPLSATTGSIPPEATQHAANLAVELLVASTPNMGFSVKESFDTLLKEAKEWLMCLRKGDPVEYPSDPILVDTSGFAAADVGNGGDVVGEVDMSTDFSSPTISIIVQQGSITYTTDANPNGVLIGNIGDSARQITNGIFIKEWIKVAGSGTDGGWA